MPYCSLRSGAELHAREALDHQRVADILGDWREEVLYRRKDGKSIRLYVTTFPTSHRFWSLMEDPCYRNSVAAENAGYNVCPEPSFYFGPDLRGHGVWFRGCYIP